MGPLSRAAGRSSAWWARRLRRASVAWQGELCGKGTAVLRQGRQEGAHRLHLQTKKAPALCQEANDWSDRRQESRDKELWGLGTKKGAEPATHLEAAGLALTAGDQRARRPELGEVPAAGCHGASGFMQASALCSQLQALAVIRS